ncbi:sodium- and chloride-dependent glycine transporter 1-like isoform X2 [Lineus longissimus]|uniref:sodium- and chloride-dependent glycine transporter 1-like isoform X2 n=1 Tax=Lineus longissimus TaxID=88925 RepID=UPI00315DD236
MLRARNSQIHPTGPEPSLGDAGAGHDVHSKEQNTPPNMNSPPQQPQVHSPPPEAEKELEKDEDEDGDENKDRGNWSNHFDFLLSCLGYAVGLGNVWRFPYLCYRNGGGAFFIPYIIMLTFVGVPIFFLELSLGQFSSSGPLTCWRFAPMFTGIGIGMVIVSGLVAIYYNMIIAWSFYYLFASFTAHLPWEGCYNWWNTDMCYTRIPDVNCTEVDAIKYNNGTCYNQSTNQITGLWSAALAKNNSINRKTASEEYYENYILGLSSGVDEIGQIRWQLVLALIVAWIVVFLCLCKGVKSSGKVVYFTALFPYLVLVILLIRGVLLEGHIEGIKFYITPQIDRLGDAQVWIDAAVQIFFSLSACWGGLITLASYNRFQNNCLRDALIVSLGNCLTSIFAGFVIFSFLGYLAKELNTTVDNVAQSGAGLAFVVYPDAVTRMPISPLWAILFFVMLITLGLDSQFTLMETVVTALIDRFPDKLRKRKTWVILVLSLVLFVLGLLLCTNGGVYWLQLMDTYAGGWSVLLIGLCETLTLSWVYGWNRLFKDIKIMIGPTVLLSGILPWWWRICWGVLTPGIILFVLLFSWIDYSPAKYGDYVFPEWANILGWMMSLSVVIFIPIYAIYSLCTVSGTFLERLKKVTRPADDWGPALVKHRRLVTYVPGFMIDPSNPSSPENYEYHQAQNAKKDGPVEYADSLTEKGCQFDAQFVNPAFDDKD